MKGRERVRSTWFLTPYRSHLSFITVHRERERERWELHDPSEQIANEQLIKPFYMPYLATSIFQPVTTITQEFL